jgi:hypothetical protein
MVEAFWSILRLLQRAGILTLDYMGVTKTVALGSIILFLSRLIYIRKTGGRESLNKEWKGTLKIPLLLNVIWWAFVFMFCVVKAVYDDHWSLLAAISQKAEAIKEKEKIIGEQKKTIEGLQAELKKQPQVIYRDKPTSGANDAEAARRAELEQREKKKAIRTEISRLIEEGTRLRSQFFVTEIRPELAPKVDDWGLKTYKYLRSVDLGYSSRFNSVRVDKRRYQGVPDVNAAYADVLTAQLDILALFVGELKD